MVYLIRNEASWEKDHRSTSFPGRPASCLFTSELGMFGMGAIYYSVTICEQNTKDCARST